MSRQTALLSLLAAVLVAALWWLFLYSPGQESLAEVEQEIAAAEAEQASLTTRIASLEAVRARAPETEAAIAQLRSFVPDDIALPGALRQLAAAADDAGAEIATLSTTRPTVVDEAIGLHEASLTLTVEGSYFQLVDFLRRVEDPRITARGIDFTTLTITAGEYPTLVASMAGQMYSVLPPAPNPDDAAAEPPPAADDDADAEGEDS